MRGLQIDGSIRRLPLLTLQIEDPGSADARGLIAQLDDYQSGLYPAESNHLLLVDALRRPSVTFVLARMDDCAAGCAAFVNQGGAYAEIKRMFVVTSFRGMRVGERMLRELECLICKSGLSIARLETGIAQPEAIRLYEKSGYRRCGPFGAYAEDPLSIFMEKTLSADEAETNITLPKADEI